MWWAVGVAFATLRVAVANGVGLLKLSRNVFLRQPFRSFFKRYVSVVKPI